MDKLLSLLLNFATNFLLAFVVVGLLRDRSAGLKAGVAFGLLGAVAAWLLSDRMMDDAETGPTLDDLAVAEPTA